MILLDTDILVFSQKAPYHKLRTQLQWQAFSASLITKLEALGYHPIGDEEASLLGIVLSSIPVLPITEEIINRAITVRRQYKMGSPDAIIAVTAMTHNLELWTHNTRDFKDIKGLKMFDPLEDIK